MAPALSGCLDPPPEYHVPDRVPPVIMTDELDPSTSSLNRRSSDKVEFTVPFRADDAGEGLLAYFIRDIPAGKPKFTHVVDDPVRIPASPLPFAEQERSFKFPWSWKNDVPAGCHTITLILSHESNFDTTNGEVDVLEPSKAARATWFLALSESGASVSCGDWPDPSMGGPPP